MNDPVPIIMTAVDQMELEQQLLIFYQHVTLKRPNGQSTIEFKPTAVHLAGLHRSENRYMITLDHNDRKFDSPMIFSWLTIAIPEVISLILKRGIVKEELMKLDWNALLQQAPAISEDVVRYHDWGDTVGSVWLGQCRQHDLWAIPRQYVENEMAIIAQCSKNIDDYFTYPIKHGRPTIHAGLWKQEGWRRYNRYLEQKNEK